MKKVCRHIYLNNNDNKLRIYDNSCVDQTRIRRLDCETGKRDDIKTSTVQHCAILSSSLLFFFASSETRPGCEPIKASRIFPACTGRKKKKKGLIHQNSYGSPKQEVLRYHEQEYFAENEKNEPFLWHDVNSFANAMRNGVRECVSEVCASQTCVSQTHLSVTCTGSIWKQFDAINMSITSIVIITG